MRTRNLSQLILLGVFFFIAGVSFGQIELSDETTKENEKEQEKEKKVTSSSTTEAIVYANWSKTNRTLVTNEGLFGKPLGERELEDALSTWSFGVAFRDRFKPHLAWEGGISYMRNGEHYLYEEPDTMFTYNTTYTYIGMPVKVYYVYGNQFRVYAGGGVIPQMFTKYTQEQEWRTSTNATDSETIKKKNGYTTFVISAVANVGFQLDFGTSASLVIMPEFRYQLNSTYVKTAAFKHNARALGLNMGLSWKI